MAAPGKRGFTWTREWIRLQEESHPAWIETPFGSRLIFYADLTATGRHLEAVESWIDGVRPYYANTHTEIATTGRMMGDLRRTAREIIRRSVNAGEDDVVLFTGSGATAAANKLLGLLGLRIPEPLEREFSLSGRIPPERRPVVFIGPYEHHSNELPWLESIAEVVEIPLDGEGAIDLEALAAGLREHADRPLKIGSFSAASNVSGVLTDVEGIARLLHRNGALAVFDYAAAAPYVPIDMHPADGSARIDALFLSPHKFLGGPGASGVLVAGRELFRTRTPERPGGGTVRYVAGSRRQDVDYVEDLAEREEGGTPAILGDMRAALAFLVKESAGPEAIRDHEIAISRKAISRLSAHPRIRILGPPEADRLAIIPLEIEGLHHDLASALLDHLFGIQNRAGCSCAGPYGHRLLGVDAATSGKVRDLLARGVAGIKPGWVRLSLPWYASEEELEFVLAAVEFVADHGMDFVPLYRFGWRDSVWRPLEGAPSQAALPALTMEALERLAGRERPEPGRIPAGDPEGALGAERAGYLREARELARSLAARWASEPPVWNRPTGDPDLDALVWFRYVETDPP